jgi:hypothetical protein
VCAGAVSLSLVSMSCAGVQHRVAAGNCCRSCERQPLAAAAAKFAAYCCAACTVHATGLQQGKGLYQQACCCQCLCRAGRAIRPVAEQRGSGPTHCIVLCSRGVMQQLAAFQMQRVGMF